MSKNLFNEAIINDFLSDHLAKLKKEVENMELKAIMDVEETSLISDLLKKYTIFCPNLKENEIKIDASEVDLQESLNSILIEDFGSAEQKVLSVVVEVPFTGNGNMFRFQPSNYAYSISGEPEYEIQNGKIILEFKTADSNPENIKRFWKNALTNIKTNLQNLERDLTYYNGSLENSIRKIVVERKNKAKDKQSLIDAIKKG